MERFTLSASERIKNSKEITTLIRQGQAFFSSPYKVYYSWNEKGQTPVLIAFAVPKRKFGKAVVRNRLKRLGRECFRKQKSKLVSLCEKKNQQLNLLLMYQRSSVYTYRDVEKSMSDIIKKIEQQDG